MPGQVEHADGQLQVLGDAGVMEIEPGLLEMVLHRIGWAFPLEGTHQPREAGLHIGVEAE